MVHKEGEAGRWLQSFQNSHSGFPQPSRDLKGDRSKCCLLPAARPPGLRGSPGKGRGSRKGYRTLSTWHRKGTRSKMTLIDNNNNFSILGPQPIQGTFSFMKERPWVLSEERAYPITVSRAAASFLQDPICVLTSKIGKKDSPSMLTCFSIHPAFGTKECGLVEMIIWRGRGKVSREEAGLRPAGRRQLKQKASRAVSTRLHLIPLRYSTPTSGFTVDIKWCSRSKEGLNWISSVRSLPAPAV